MWTWPFVAIGLEQLGSLMDHCDGVVVEGTLRLLCITSQICCASAVVLNWGLGKGAWYGSFLVRSRYN